jgi:hypothetical protein
MKGEQKEMKAEQKELKGDRGRVEKRVIKYELRMALNIPCLYINKLTHVHLM